MAEQTFHQILHSKMDEYAHLVYRLTKMFPKEERYGVTSQIRRSSLSVILNYTEGYARGKYKIKLYINFLETSYGSLQESKYLLDFSLKEHYLTQENFKVAHTLADEIGAMLWKTISTNKNNS